MDDDPLPRASHATRSKWSPPYSPQLYALKSSSPPPLFSENDSLESADATVYESPRLKRKRAGTWWQTYSKAKKPRQFVRNVDSGVYMMSDDSEISAASSSALSSSRLDASQDIASDPPAPPPESEHQDEGVSVDRGTQTMSPLEYKFYISIQGAVEHNVDSYHFYNCGIEDSWLQHLEMLRQVVSVPPDASTEVPAEGQYRSMEPELHINLGRNNLCRLSPSLFSLEFLVDLTLRYNAITVLPPQITKLTHLRTLDICFNQIRTLPCEFLALCQRPTGALKSIWLTGNPLVEVSNNDSFPRGARFNPNEQRWAPTIQKSPTLRDRILKSGPSGGHHLFAPCYQILDSKNPEIMFVSRTTVAYYDQSGRLLANCPPLPMARQGDYDAPDDRPRTQPGLMIQTVLGAYNIPETWFEPPRHSKVKSLIVQSLNTAYTMCEREPEAVREELREFMDGNDASLTNADRHLATAENNAAETYSPFRTCHCCGEKYIVARAEWIEGWLFDQEIIPIRVAVCSWACVPDFIAKKPAELQW